MATQTIKISPRYVDLANNNGLFNGAEYGGPGTTTIKSSADTNTWVAVNVNDVANLSSACCVTAIHYSFTYRSGTDAFHGSRAILYQTRPIYRVNGTNHTISDTWGKSTGDTGSWTKYCDADPSSSGECTYSGNMSLGIQNAVGVQFRCESYKYTSFAREFYLKDVKVGYTRTRACYITFTGTNVSSTTRYYDYGDTVSVPTPTARVGWIFRGWKTDPNASAYLTSNQIPAAGEVDVTYTAYWEKTPYNINVQAVNQSGSTITAPAGLTGNRTYYLDDPMICTAPSGDYIFDTNTTYQFRYWSIHKSNGDTIVDYYGSREWNLGILNTDTIAEWFIDSTNTVVAKAHYQIVYDLSLSLVTNTTNDPGKLGHIGLNSIAILDSSDNPLKDLSGNNIPSIAVSDLWNSSTDSAQSKTVRVYTNDFRLRIYLANTSHTDDYYIASSSNPSGCTVTGFTDNTNPTPYDATGAVGNALNYRVVASSSTCSWGVEVLKRYFSITINNNTPTYDGNSYHVVKVYRGSGNVEITPTNLSRILRGSPTIKIDASEDATKDTPYNAYFRRGSTSADLIEFNINDLKDNYEFTTYATLAPFFTVDTVIDGVSQQVSAYRTKAYTFNIPADTGYKMTATLTEGGTITKTWTQVESISYALPKGVVANTVLNVQKIPTSTAFMHLNTDDCVYGSIEVANNAYDILKTSFQNFTINSIAAHTNYEIVSATYEWRENGTPISGKSGYLFNGTSPVNQIMNKTITFGGSIPAQNDITCVVSVRFRKNIIYHSHGTGAGFTLERPQSLWYTPVGQAPQRVVAVYAQTASHPAPILLFGDVE